VFNATFNNISVISWRSVLLMGATGKNLEKTTDLLQTPEKLYFKMFYCVHLSMRGFRTQL
jgi:hypothetical protein